MLYLNFDAFLGKNLTAFHLSAHNSLFSSDLSVSCPRTLFSSILGIKMTWRATNINYPLHADVNNLIGFSAQLGDFDYFMAQKYLYLENKAYNYLIKIELPLY